MIQYNCSVCNAPDPKVLNTEVGLIVMCEKCVLLGVEAAKEAVESSVKPSLDTPGSLRGNPATCTLILHSYFKVHSYLVH